MNTAKVWDTNSIVEIIISTFVCTSTLFRHDIYRAQNLLNPARNGGNMSADRWLVFRLEAPRENWPKWGKGGGGGKRGELEKEKRTFVPCVFFTPLATWQFSNKWQTGHVRLYETLVVVKPTLVYNSVVSELIETKNSVHAWDLLKQKNTLDFCQLKF